MTDHASSPIRIGLDGYNLALPQGTGVATYGRNLAAAIDQLGYPVDLVFGVNIPRKADVDLHHDYAMVIPGIVMKLGMLLTRLTPMPVLRLVARLSG